MEIDDTDEKSMESNYASIPKYPPSDVVAIVKPGNGEGNDLYELMETPRHSNFNKKDSETYAVPLNAHAKKSNISDDFEIQVDTDHDKQIKRNYSSLQNDCWFTPPSIKQQQPVSETQEDEGWKTIRVPKEDIMIHAPSSPVQRDQLQHSIENGDILQQR